MVQQDDGLKRVSVKNQTGEDDGIHVCCLFHPFKECVIHLMFSSAAVFHLLSEAEADKYVGFLQYLDFFFFSAFPSTFMCKLKRLIKFGGWKCSLWRQAFHAWHIYDTLYGLVPFKYDEPLPLTSSEPNALSDLNPEKLRMSHFCPCLK